MAIVHYPISLEEVRKKAAKKNGRHARRIMRSIDNIPTHDFIHSNVKEQMNEFGEKIIRVDGEIPTDLPITQRQRYLFISYDQTILTHGLHKYPAKFFPELPRWLIRKYSKENDIVLDPFSGSGTTNLEALLNGRHSVGIDVDPFSRYLGRVKTTPLDEKKLRESLEELLKAILDFRPCLVNERDVPSFPYRSNWFNHEIILELAYIKKSIQELDVDERIKDFYKICFSSIIRAVSNADNHCTRTVIRKKLNKKVCPSDALTKFAETILTNVPRIIEFSRRCPCEVKVDFPVGNDARYINYLDDYFDLAVTSPPYANAVDYPRTHQLEIYWLGFVNGSLTPLKRKHVGNESVRAEDYNSLHTIGIKKADRVIEKIYDRDPRRAYIAYKYLYDMSLNLKEVYRVLKQRRRYVVVVGNNRIRGEIFENWLYLLEIAEKVGFEVETYFASEIIRHFIKVPREERIDTDWIIVLKK